MDMAHGFLIFFALLSVALYALGLIMAIGVIEMLSKRIVGRQKFLRAAAWPWWILRAWAEGNQE